MGGKEFIMNIYHKKTRKIFTAVLAIFLVLAMLVPMLLYLI